MQPISTHHRLELYNFIMVSDRLKPAGARRQKLAFTGRTIEFWIFCL
jgi:hypothetical protein